MERDFWFTGSFQTCVTSVPRLMKLLDSPASSSLLRKRQADTISCVRFLVYRDLSPRVARQKTRSWLAPAKGKTSLLLVLSLSLNWRSINPSHHGRDLRVCSLLSVGLPVAWPSWWKCCNETTRTSKWKIRNGCYIETLRMFLLRGNEIDLACRDWSLHFWKLELLLSPFKL